jgi:peptidoglycan/LPS O-acetylase OafA/YrhL
MRDQARHVYVTLDGLRGIAAIIVAERHTRGWFGHHVLQSGYLAVDFFFLLSGFVIAHAYDQRLRDGMPFIRFMAARVIRLYPLYLIGIVLTAIVEIYHRGYVSPYTLLCAALFLPNFPGSSRASWFVGASWSLSFELISNAVYAAFHRELNNRLLLGISAAGFALCAYCAFTFHGLDIGYRHPHILGGFARVTFAFFFGVYIYRNQVTLPSFSRFLSIPAIISMVAVMAIDPGKEMRPWVDLLSISILMPTILIVASQTVPSALSDRIFRWLGTISYGVYVLHSSSSKLLDIMVKETAGRGIAAHGMWAGAVAIAVIVAVVYVLDIIYDRPARKWLNRLLISPSSRSRDEPVTAP